MSEDNKNNKYEAFKIPDRKPEQNRGAFQPSPKPNVQPISSLSDGMFYEIEYDSCSIPGVGKYVQKPKPQKIDEPEKDEIRELFLRMRDIARAHRSTYDFSRFFDRRVQNDNAIIFYRQAVFMKDFTDDYAGNAQFSGYFPCYQMLGYDQLRTYFTWRTGVRQGNVAATSLSYAFLYIYELLCNIGVTDPQDGLCKLMFFWKAFREHDKFIDKYVLRWLKDYHIYYELPHTFKEFAEKNGLAGHYPKLAGADDSFDLFCSISKYNIRKSAFFTDETSGMISDCFAYVMDSIRRNFEAAGMNFDDALFRPTRKLVPWKPFKDALFYNPVNQADRQIVLSQNEIYMCKGGQWTFSTAITTEKGRQFIGYVMKQMESVLRKLKKYRFRLTANTDMINEDTIRILTNAGLFIDKIVTAAVMEYHRDATKIVVTVDHASLARIRQEAQKTQESLIVEEQTLQNSVEAIPMQFTAQDQNMFADTATKVDEETAPFPDVWENLKDILTGNELRALEVVLQGDDIKAFAHECEVMIEVLVDGINEKAMDYIGDNLMDEDFVLYDDYKETVGRMLTSERN